MKNGDILFHLYIVKITLALLTFLFLTCSLYSSTHEEEQFEEEVAGYSTAAELAIVIASTEDTSIMEASARDTSLKYGFELGEFNSLNKEKIKGMRFVKILFSTDKNPEHLSAGEISKLFSENKISYEILMGGFNSNSTKIVIDAANISKLENVFFLRDVDIDIDIVLNGDKVKYNKVLYDLNRQTITMVSKNAHKSISFSEAIGEYLKMALMDFSEPYILGEIIQLKHY